MRLSSFFCSLFFSLSLFCGLCVTFASSAYGSPHSAGLTLPPTPCDNPPRSGVHVRNVLRFTPANLIRFTPAEEEPLTWPACHRARVAFGA